METRNAIITSATLSNGDHGILSGFLQLDYGGSCQGFGGYCLFNPNFPGDVCGLWIWNLLEIAGVTEFSKLVGKTVRVRMTESKVIAIGHIVKDKWFNPEQEFSKRNKS